MYLKIVSDKIKLPHFVTQGLKGFVFPAGPLPSVCVEEFSPEGGNGLLQRSASFAVATDEEVKAALGNASVDGDTSDPDPVSKVLVLKEDDVVDGTITAGQVLGFEPSDLGAFLEEVRPSKETVEALLVLAGELQAPKKLKAKLKDYLESNG